MEPDAIISDTDLRRLEIVAKKNEVNKKFLSKLLGSKKVVKNRQVDKKTVRLNSIVFLWHSILRRVVRFRIVLPHQADLKRKRISVFAPISMAIFGSREMEAVTVNDAGVKKLFRIIRVES